MGSRATFELRPLFVCSTLTLLTESLQRRKLAVCANFGPGRLQQSPERLRMICETHAGTPARPWKDRPVTELRSRHFMLPDQSSDPSVVW
jgi:hypothetical protein